MPNWNSLKPGKNSSQFVIPFTSQLSFYISYSTFILVNYSNNYQHDFDLWIIINVNIWMQILRAQKKLIGEKGKNLIELNENWFINGNIYNK